MSLSNLFSNRLDNLIDSSNEENIISCCSDKNATNPQLPAIWENEVTGDSKLDERMEDLNEDTLDLSFFYWGVIKCNW